MVKTKSKKQSDKDTIAEVTLEMAKPRVAMSARECGTDENRDSGRVTDDPKELLRQKVAEELAAPSQATIRFKDSNKKSPDASPGR
jgi:hypothetical protein